MVVEGKWKGGDEYGVGGWVGSGWEVMLLSAASELSIWSYTTYLVPLLIRLPETDGG